MGESILSAGDHQVLEMILHTTHTHVGVYRGVIKSEDTPTII